MIPLDPKTGRPYFPGDPRSPVACPICQTPVDQPARGRKKLTCGEACAHSYRVTRQRLARAQGRSIAALESALLASEDLPWAAAIRDLLDRSRDRSGSELAAHHFAAELRLRRLAE